MSNSDESESRGSPSSSRKRKHSGGDEEGRRVRPFKHRSSRACQSCRTRKVRCDVVANGCPCTNCRLDNEECIVLASRRGRPGRTESHPIAHATHSLSPHQATTTQISPPGVTREDGGTVHEERLTQIVASGPRQVPVSVTFDEDVDTEASNELQATDGPNRAGADSTHPTSQDGLPTPETAPNTSKPHNYQSPTERSILPAFITPLSGRVLSEDIDFLIHKGAFVLPEPELRVEILRGYLFSVHPFMPMLNFRAFTHAVLNDREDSQISLLLFQAVMFAGLHSLELQVIHRLGFESAKQAREVFFHRVRLLYEFDVESDSAAVLQSLILMSSYYSKGNERRHTWHFTGLAYDIARSMGLHREPTTRRYPSDKMRRFRRRLWWSLYIRDRMIALGTRRPMRIRDDEFDVAMLTLEDFDLEPLDEFNQGQPLIPAPKDNTSTALMCIQLARLGKIIGRVVSSQYTTLASQSDIPHTMMVVSRQGDGRTEDLESCDRELSEWWQALSSKVGWTGAPTAPNEPPHICAEVHWAMLTMTYLTVVNVLHRAQALQPLTDSTEAPSMQSVSRTKVKEAARSLTQLSQTMLNHDQVRFLGLIGVTALVAACLSHMLDVNSGDVDIRDASTFRLYQSLEALQALRGIYASADAAVDFLASVTRKAGISIPTQVAAQDFGAASSAEALVNLSRNRRQSAAWREVVSPASRQVQLNKQRNSAPNVDWVNGTSPIVPQEPYSHAQPQTIEQGDGQIQPGGGAMQPSAVSFPSSITAPVSSYEQQNDVTRDITAPGHQISQLIDSTGSRGLPNAAAANAGFFDWNGGGIDTGAIMDPTLTVFNYDFYSDAFGFLDGYPQGM